jgi:flagellar biogenesis protein FliO
VKRWSGEILGETPVEDLFTKIGGLPAHPLFAHAPIVLVPLLAIVGIGYAVLPFWRVRIGWALVALAVVTPFVAVLTAQSGEALQDALGNNPTIQAHAQLGEMARNLAGLLGLLALALVLVDVLRHRRVGSGWTKVAVGAAVGPAAAGPGGAQAMPVPAGTTTRHAVRSPALRILSLVLSVLVVVASVLALIWVVRAGHTGSAMVWEGRI